MPLRPKVLRHRAAPLPPEPANAGEKQKKVLGVPIVIPPSSGPGTASGERSEPMVTLRLHGHGWGSEGFWALAIDRMERA